MSQKHVHIYNHLLWKFNKGQAVSTILAGRLPALLSGHIRRCPFAFQKWGGRRESAPEGGDDDCSQAGLSVFQAAKGGQDSRPTHREGLSQSLVGIFKSDYESPIHRRCHAAAIRLAEKVTLKKEGLKSGYNNPTLMCET
ncbi:MAG: hypothetical protein ACYSSI_00230 [Planctomycetota bacterium]